MAKLRLDRYKSLVALLAFIAAWWIVPTFVKSFLHLSFSEFQAPSWVVNSYLNDLQDFWARRSHSKVELIQVGKELERSKARYQVMAQRYETLEGEVERLESLLNMPSRREFRNEVARVIRRDQSAWWSQLLVRKGRDFGITEGSAVIFAGGVVGRVVEVNAFTSHIDLITSPNFRISAEFEGDERPVTYQGVSQSTFADPYGSVLDAPQDLVANSQDPLRLVTTSLGGTFPPGLAIGTVAWLEPGSTGIFQTGKVQLNNGLLNLREVTILIPLDQMEDKSDVF